MGQMKLIDSSEFVDRVLGKVGTPERDAMEMQIKEERESYMMGESLKKARVSQNLTQEQLSKKAGVDRSQVSRLERGKSATLSSIKRISQALGVMLW
jgi:DNA-binding XRE family transcriptional regulator|nr:MAG TPA: helix-turn-helix domain protein [Caudoviricetes sp.]